MKLVKMTLVTSSRSIFKFSQVFFKNNILKHFTQDHSTNRILLRVIVFVGPRSRWCTKYQDFNSLSIFNDFHRSIHPCTDTKGQLVVSRRTAPSSRRLVHPDLSTQTRYGLDSAAPAELVEDPVRAAADAHIARPRPTATPMRCRQCFPNSIADQW